MKHIFLLWSCVSALLVHAQGLPKNLSEEEKERFGQRLVQLAYQNNPHSRMMSESVELAQYDVKLAKMEWLNTVTVSGNLNEFTLSPQSDVYNRSAYYPKYNISGRISVGMFFTIPYNIQKSRQQLQISETMKEENRVTLEAEVLRRYNDYLMNEKIYRLQSEMMMDAENKFQVSEEKFRSGEIPFEEYSSMRSGVSSAQMALYRAEASFANAKVSLEELIGVKLEDVLIND